MTERHAVVELAKTRKVPRRVQFHCDLYFPEVHAGIVDYARSANWMLYDGKCYLPSNPYTEPCDGMLVIVAQKEMADWAKKQTCPKVRLLCSSFAEKEPSVETDPKAIGSRGAEHFLTLGAPNCVFYTGWMIGENELMWNGFKSAMAAAGRTATLLNFGEGRSIENSLRISREERWQWLAEKLSHLPRPLAVMAEDDRFVYDVVEAANRLGWRIPEDLAVLGADDRELILGKIPIPISSVDSQLRKIGWEGAALLDRILDGETPPSAPIRIAPGEVKARRSTATFVCDQPAVNTAVTFLRNHFHESLRIDGIARVAGLSERSLQNLFKQHVGCTISEELSRVRLAHAARLLRETDLKLDSVAHESGLRSAKYLCEVFRAAFQTTPATYRERTLVTQSSPEKSRVS